IRQQVIFFISRSLVFSARCEKDLGEHFYSPLRERRVFLMRFIQQLLGHGIELILSFPSLEWIKLMAIPCHIKKKHFANCTSKPRSLLRDLQLDIIDDC